MRFQEIKGKKDFGRIEIVNEKMMNVVAGLELHTGVFNAEQQKRANNYGVCPTSIWALAAGNQFSSLSYGNQADQLLTASKGWQNGDWICTCGFHKCSPRAQNIDMNSLGSWEDGANGWSETLSEPSMRCYYHVEQSEHMRFQEIKGKKDFGRIEIVNEKMMNVVAGLELHTGVFNAEQQKVIVDSVYKLQKKGKEGKLEGQSFLVQH
ncbi:unnamed protein product [Ilex paraguariensis]|uniref:Uncharacterized protein n=1 Tax=Ilex paraguariensis TaxID=185542 RepID=A0ABC8UAD5_9AQUA